LIRHFIRYYLWIIFFCTISSIKLFAQQVSFSIERISVEDGLSHNSVLGIARDKYGFMWFSTYAGLNRYDGYNIKQYINWQPNDKYSGLNLRDVVAGKNGGLWVSDGSNLAFKYDFKRDSFIYVPQTLPNFTSQGKTFIDSKGNYWLLNGIGLSFSRATDGIPEITYDVTWNQPILGETQLFTICEDNPGNIWIGGVNRLFKIQITQKDTNVFMYSYFNSYNESPLNIISAILPDESGFLLVGSQDGLRKIKISDLEKYESLDIIPAEILVIFFPEKHGPYDNVIAAIQSDGNEHIYLRTSRGIDVLNNVSGEIIHLSDEGAFNNFDSDEGMNNWSAFYYTPEGILWVGTDKGVLKIRKNRNNFNILENRIENPEYIKDKRLKNVLVDTKGNIWMGTIGEGIITGNLKSPGNKFNLIQFKHEEGNPKSLNFDVITSISEPVPGEVFIGSVDFQRAESNKNGISFQAPDRNYNDITSSIFTGPYWKNIIFLENKLWLFEVSGKIQLIDTLSWERKDFYLTKKKNLIANSCLTQAPDGEWYLLENSGIHKISFPLKQLDSSCYIPNAVETLTINDSGFKWFSGQRKMIITELNNEKQFWVTSMTGGLSLYQLELIKEIPETKGNNPAYRLALKRTWNTGNGLCNNSVLDIIEDFKKRIWISTRNGLVRLDPKTGDIQNFYESDGIPCDKLYWGSSMDKTGNIYFCSSKGLVSFNPDSISINETPPKLFITNIRLFNKPIIPGPDSPLDNSAYLTKKIKLHYHQNFISLEYVALNYQNTFRNRYKYKLEGLNSEWVDAGERRFAEYQDLKPGRYTFFVIGSNDHGVWNTEGTSLEIIITPPFWLRAWFIAIILCCLAGSLVWIIKNREKSLRLRNIWLEKEVDERTAQAISHQTELEHMKSRFYTNISHEFRTPLTLINGSTEELARTTSEPRSQNFLQTIRKASSHLLKLVNELLDLARIEAGNLNLEVSEGNLTDTVKLVWQIYLSEAERKRISLTFLAEPEVITCWYDPSYIEKILHNLVSNALKFTESGGQIEINLRRPEQNSFLISVKDTGKGIPEEKLKRIFDRFYQVESSDSRSGEGTGIGLALVKELVQLHHGSVSVKSSAGQGTVFIVSIPALKEAYSAKELLEIPLQKNFKTIDTAAEPIEPILENSYKKEKNHRIDPEKPLILIAEDNDDLRQYITQLMNREYRVLEAGDGNSALEQITEFMPEIIITDIMMQGMDGIELCKKIKEKELTCHIPVIMLTAKADMSSKLEGLQAGADDYLMKPFYPEELLVRTSNLILHHRRLKKKFSETAILTVSEFTNNSIDEGILQRAVELVKNNLSNDEYSILEFDRDLGMSPRSAQRKIKALTGLSPNEFIRTVRIKIAAGLLSEKRDNISQVAYMVGFTNLSYFSKSFREVFGVNPSEYKS
jgi:signal transduction histidine kinase/DNA-binding response OmpR family regulator/ligand-binding sensor domain-containing protein